MTLLLFFGAGAGVTVMPAQLLPLLRGRAEREQPVLKGGNN